MKTKLILISIFLIFISAFAAAQSRNVTASIKVYGNCGMCKKRIETALDHKGVKLASWDTKTKELRIVYNSDKVSELQVHGLVASAGHDTDKVKAKDEVYAALPFCCLYRDHAHDGKDNH